MEKKEKELRRMSRTELIEIIYALQQKEKELQQELDEAHRQLSVRTIKMEKVGSIAEAALSLNNVFEDAQAAANQYLESLKVLCDEELSLTKTTSCNQAITSCAEHPQRMRSEKLVTAHKQTASPSKPDLPSVLPQPSEKQSKAHANSQSRLSHQVAPTHKKPAHAAHSKPFSRGTKL